MNRYTIICTPEQTKKAIGLGAPITRCYNRFENMEFSPIFKEGDKFLYALIPTAEQMCGWLEEQDGIEEIDVTKFLTWSFDIYGEDCDSAVGGGSGFATRKEVTLAAIDAVLDYLIKNKK